MMNPLADGDEPKYYNRLKRDSSSSSPAASRRPHPRSHRMHLKHNQNNAQEEEHENEENSKLLALKEHDDDDDDDTYDLEQGNQESEGEEDEEEKETWSDSADDAATARDSSIPAVLSRDKQRHQRHHRYHRSDTFSPSPSPSPSPSRSPGRRRKGSRSGCLRTMMSFRSVVDTVLLLVILGLVVERRWGRGSGNGNENGDGGGKFEFAGDLTGFAPRFSQQIKTFVPDPGFIPQNSSEFFTKGVREKWLGIVPKGLGYVRISNDTMQKNHYDNLPHPLKGYPDRTFTTSMTHQLHCLHAIVGTFAAITSDRPEMMPEEGPWHLAHCFEYLRQSIMCCGDVALEGQHTTFPAGLKGSDGWDAKHVCKDYGQMMEYLEENRVDDEIWI